MEQNSMDWMVLIAFAPLLIIAIIGYYFKHNPPKNINGLVGYRTKRSMSSQNAWDFSQVYSSNLLYTWSIAGILGLGLQLLLSKSKNVETLTLSGTILIAIITIGTIYYTEKELKDKF